MGIVGRKENVLVMDEVVSIRSMMRRENCRHGEESRRNRKGTLMTS